MKSEHSKSTKLMSDTSIKHGVSDLWDNINSSFEKIHLSENNDASFADDRLSPYENIKGHDELQTNNQLNIPESEMIKRNTLKPERGTNGILNAQYPDQNSFAKNQAPVIVDVAIPHDHALNEINGVNHNCSLVPVQVNETVQLQPKTRPNNSPEFIFSYPREAFNAGRNSNVTVSIKFFCNMKLLFKITTGGTLVRFGI